jgi:hypothetical protein
MRAALATFNSGVKRQVGSGRNDLTIADQLAECFPVPNLPVHPNNSDELYPGVVGGTATPTTMQFWHAAAPVTTGAVRGGGVGVGVSGSGGALQSGVKRKVGSGRNESNRGGTKRRRVAKTHECPTCHKFLSSLSGLRRHSKLHATDSPPGSSTVDWKTVLHEVRLEAERAHHGAYASLLKRCLALNYTEPAVLRMLTYIREYAPLVIHFRPQLLTAFTATSEYHSCYGRGPMAYQRLKPDNARANAENLMFGKRYNNALGRERVKYGALNICADPQGSAPAHSYGDAYLLLKPHMRMRVTVTPCDSFALTDASPKVATPDNFAHLLADKLHVTDADLRQALEIGSQLLQSDARPQKTVEGLYREIQIHGPILFKQDIDAVVIPTKWRDLFLQAANTFSEHHKIPVIWV